MTKEASLGTEKFLMLEWEDIVREVEDLAEKVKGSGFNPDALVGILRGGLFVANLLSDVLNVEDVVPMGIRSYVGVKERRAPIVYHKPGMEVLNGKRVLLVDDVSDEGKTLQVATSLISGSSNPAVMRSAVLHIKPWTKFVPDYYVLKTSHWILYPWSRYESLRNLWKQMSGLMPEDLLLDKLSELVGMDRDRIRAIVLAATA
ncbi:MAG: phosphoribosyltransferase [Thaumarchaeota archaeon]|nr:phosphoribosyltransferase [Candidatus Calditenuaceae archaeon]